MITLLFLELLQNISAAGKNDPKARPRSDCNDTIFPLFWKLIFDVIAKLVNQTVNKMNQSNNLIEEEQKSCTKRLCIHTDDKTNFRCVKCHRSVHYQCSELLGYMIQQLVSSRHRKFQCCNCVDVSDAISSELSSSKTEINNEVIKRLKNEIQSCENNQHFSPSQR